VNCFSSAVCPRIVPVGAAYSDFGIVDRDSICLSLYSSESPSLHRGRKSLYGIPSVVLPSPYLRITFTTISFAGICEYLLPSSATPSQCFSINLFLKASGVLLGSAGCGFGGRNVCFTAAGFTTGEVCNCGSVPFLRESTAHIIPH